MTFRTLASLLLSATLLAACGSGGGSGGSGTGDTTVEYTSFFDSEATGQNDLAVFGIRSSDLALLTASGTVDHDNNTITLDNVSGTFDDILDGITISGGGVGTIIDFGTNYVTMASLEPTTTDGFLGVFGIQTDPTDMPANLAAPYDGDAIVQIITYDTVVDLTGTALVEVDFSKGTADLTIASLQGSSFTPGLTPVTINRAGQISAAGTVSGVGLSADTLTWTSNEVTLSFTENATSTMTGAFFGPSAAEAGGIFEIDDTASANETHIHGMFVGVQK